MIEKATNDIFRESAFNINITQATTHDDAHDVDKKCSIDQFKK